MKTNCWLVLGMMIATSAVAQVSTNTLPEIPAPAPVAVAPVVEPVVMVNTNEAAPVKKSAAPKKKAVIKLKEPSVALLAGTAKVLPPNLNLRGQAGVKGEVVGHLKKDDTVTVISQINLDKHAADEPGQWAKILLPTGTKVWVSSHFVDTTNKTVAVKKLNLRAGPGENYSVLGVLERGAAISELSTKGDWIQIEAPANAFAFVAAMYLEQVITPVEPVQPPPVPVVETTPVTTNTVLEAETVVASPAAIPAPAETPVVAPTNAAPATEMTSAVTSTNVSEIDTNLPPPPPRIVSHEGYVRPSVSVVAPTYYELYDPVSGKAINYLYSSTTNLNLARYNGAQIVVTGEEGMAERWASTPVITIQRIYVITTNPPTSLPRVTSPRASQQRR